MVIYHQRSVPVVWYSREGESYLMRFFSATTSSYQPITTRWGWNDLQNFLLKRRPHFTEEDKVSHLLRDRWDLKLKLLRRGSADAVRCMAASKV